MFASLYYIFRVTNISRTCVKERLKENDFQSYKDGRVQELLEGDNEKRIKFCKWYHRWNKKQNEVVLRSDDCLFQSCSSDQHSEQKISRKQKIDRYGWSKKFHFMVQVWVSISSEGNILFEMFDWIKTS